MQLEPGATVDRYLVDAGIADDGMGEVYRVRHTWLGTVHAMKLMNLANSKQLRDALLAEGRTMAAIGHPNIVRVTDALLVNGLPALVLDWVDGPSLADWLGSRRGPVPVASGLRLLDGVLSGMSHAHRLGVVHRDLKPENILLEKTPDGLVPRVTDFGMAKVFGQPGISMMFTSFGTPEYMAPEQITNPTTVDARADLWAIGCILYELYTGQLPFDGDNPKKILDAVMSGRYTPAEELRPDLPPAAAALVRDLLQHDRERRPADCREIRYRIREITG